MAKLVFTDVGLRSLQPPPKGQRSYWDAKLPTFGVRVSQGGSKTFIVNQHNTLITIGRWPLISLAEARTEAKRVLAEKTLGKVRPQSITVPLATELFLEEKTKARRRSTVADLKDRLSRHFNLTGQLADVTHHEIVRRLSRIKTPREHNAALRVAKTFFTWAVNRRYISDNPTRGIFTHSIASRARVLTDDELRRVWIGAGEIGGSFGTIVKLLILTGQRRGEIAALQTSWIKDETIVFPESVTKNKREHFIPIGALCSSLLPSQSFNGLLFSARGKPSQPFNGWSKAKAALDRRLGGTVAPWTIHDLRRTFATRMAELGVQPHVVERLLNHATGTLSPIALTYNKASYLKEMRAAVDLYQEYLQRLFEN
ncbi:MAG: tyrosine-type recombinase/integrase [Rhodoplanes sp.]